MNADTWLRLHKRYLEEQRDKVTLQEELDELAALVAAARQAVEKLEKGAENGLFK